MVIKNLKKKLLLFKCHGNEIIKENLYRKQKL